MRNSYRYTYSIEVPLNAAECSISDQLYALHSVFDDLIHDTSPEHGFESWENLFSLSPDPCGMAASATGPYRGLSCDDNGDVVKIDLSSSSLQGYLPYMADFGLGLPKLTTLDLHDNSLTGPMVYSYGDAYNFGDGDSSASVPRFNNVILDTDSVKRALLPDDFIPEFPNREIAYRNGHTSRLHERISRLDNALTKAVPTKPESGMKQYIPSPSCAIARNRGESIL